MCRQVWLPPAAGRDAPSLRRYLDRLVASIEDAPAGAGAGWVGPGYGWRIERGLRADVGVLAGIVANRPNGAWGVFHVRRAWPGNRATKWCHPHQMLNSVTTVGVIGVLTYNGKPSLAVRENPEIADLVTSLGWRINPLLVPRVVMQLGWLRAKLLLPQTVMAAIRTNPGWMHVACIKHERFPLYRLENGAVATEGAEGEFASVGRLATGTHDLLRPRLRVAAAA